MLKDVNCKLLAELCWTEELCGEMKKWQYGQVKESSQKLLKPNHLDEYRSKPCHLALQKARAPEEQNKESADFCDIIEISAGELNGDL